MDTLRMRQRLHNYLEIAEDKKIKAIYTMVENEIAESDVRYTPALKAELDRRYAAYQENPSIAVSTEESTRRTQDKLNAGRRK